MIFALLHIIIEDVSEIFPSRLGDKDRVLKVPLNFTHGDVPSLGVLLAAEEKILVLNSYVLVFWYIRGFFNFSVIVFLNEFLQVLVKVFHAIGGNENLEA